jgi:hypothetical protein
LSLLFLINQIKKLNNLILLNKNNLKQDYKIDNKENNKLKLIMEEEEVIKAIPKMNKIV